MTQNLFCSNAESYENAQRCICGHVFQSHGDNYCAISSCNGECGEKGFILICPQ